MADHQIVIAGYGTLHSVQAAGKAVRLKKVTEDIPRRYCLRGISSVMGNYLIDLK